MSSLIYVGISFYINGMVRDMKLRIVAIGKVSTDKTPRQHLQIYSLYVGEIQFHREIIGYLSNFFLSYLPVMLPKSVMH